MWVRSHSKIYKGIKKEAIWQLWTDVNNWPKWHDDLEYCKLIGNFSVGNYFILKPKNAPPVKIELVEIETNRKFTDCTRFFGAKMCDTHELIEVEGGLRLTNTLIVTGPLKWLWVKLVASHVANTVPQEMDALVILAKVYDEKISI